MRKLISSKAFVIGFLGGILIFLCLNVVAAYQMNPQPCHHCIVKFGFPFVFHEQGFMQKGNLLYFGLFADALIAIIFSFACGLLFSFERNRAK